MNKELDLIQLNTYGITDNSLISVVKIGNTKYVVTSFFNNERSFIDSMENVIKNKINS